MDTTNTNNPLNNPPAEPQQHQLTAPRIISIILLLIVLIAVPVTVIILGQQTRTAIKADVSCKSPAVPDPKDCVGGTWKLYKDVDGCIKFRCELGQ